MAIPSVPQNFAVQTGNLQILISWGLSVGATSYIVQRSLDNVTFTTITTITGSPLATLYLDTAVTEGVGYYYKVAAASSDGTSSYTTPQSAVPTTSGEMSLGLIRLRSQQRADRVNSNFVTMPEWNGFINLAMYELYDLLVTLYEDDYVATPASFTVNGSTFQYPLPNGILSFNNGITQESFIPRPFYKLIGVDLALNNAANGYVTIPKFNFVDRNRFVYPNTASTIYGVFNLQYRLIGNKIQFIPTPSANQQIRLWYIPRLVELLKDTDVTDIGISGWLQYVIVRAAKYALDKEESDTNKLDQELLYLKGRIEESAANRDAGSPDTISDARRSNGSNWPSGNGAMGGF